MNQEKGGECGAFLGVGIKREGVGGEGVSMEDGMMSKILGGSDWECMEEKQEYE